MAYDCFIGDIGNLEKALGKTIELRNEQGGSITPVAYLGQESGKSSPLHYFAISMRAELPKLVMQGFVVEQANITAVSDDGTRCSVNELADIKDRVISDSDSKLYIARFVSAAKYGEKSE